jgi:hypothetical protein
MTDASKSLSDKDFARQMARRDVVYQRPTPWWQDGLTIGNGDFGGAVFGGGPESDGKIGVTLTKVDVWDERYDRKGHRYHTLAELRKLIAEHADSEEGRKILNSLEPYGTVGVDEWYRKTYPYPYFPPTVKPVGMLRVDPGGSFEDFEARLSVHRAEVRFDLGDKSRGATLSIFVDANGNLLVIHLERYGDFDHPISLEMARYVDEQLGQPELEVDEEGFWHRYPFPGGFSYALVGVVTETPVDYCERFEAEWRDVEARTAWVPEKRGYMRNFEVEIHAPERGVRLVLPPHASAATLVVGVATSREVEDPLSHAQSLAETAVVSGIDAVRTMHRAWWDAFWRQSSLMLSDRLVESLWYQGVYTLACQSRGTIPPPLVAPGYYLPHAGWHGHYLTDFNIQMMYWPVFVANHLPLADTYFNLFLNNLETIKSETMMLYDIDGAKFPGLFISDCRELGYLPTRNWQCGGAWAAQVYWWGYLYSGDVTFLREIAYPVMREVAKFYRGYALPGEDGKYHIFPSTPPEQPPWWATDPTIDISLIRVHMAATLEASEILELDTALREGWRDLLENLAEIPNDGELFLDFRDAPPDSKLGHAGLMSPVFSAGLIGLGSPREEQEMALRSLRSVLTRTSRMVLDYPFDIPTWNDDCNWPFLIACAARLGLAEDARAWIYDYGIFQHLKPNGLFAFDCPVTEQQRETRWGMPDSSYAFVAALSEMLLQSYDGAIRIAPAVPADWDARLDGFLAVGAFEVDALISAGQPRSVTVRSLQGETCRIHHPWPGSGVAVRQGGKLTSHQEADGVIRFDTEPGGEYVIESPEQSSSGPTLGTEEQIPGPMGYRGPAFLGHVPPEARATIWLGLPDEADETRP